MFAWKPRKNIYRTSLANLFCVYSNTLTGVAHLWRFIHLPGVMIHSFPKGNPASPCMRSLHAAALPSHLCLLFLSAGVSGGLSRKSWHFPITPAEMLFSGAGRFFRGTFLVTLMVCNHRERTQVKRRAKLEKDVLLSRWISSLGRTIGNLYRHLSRPYWCCSLQSNSMPVHQSIVTSLITSARTRAANCRRFTLRRGN